MLQIETLTSEAEKINVKLDKNAIILFKKYYEFLIEWNNKMNLTAITEESEVAEKHFLDSLIILKYCNIPQNAKVIDVGTGAGFPGVVLKIIRPDIQLTLLDSLKKRIVFLNELSKELDIAFDCVHIRAEEGGRTSNMRETYDIATARAVAKLSVLAEYCLPFVKVGGEFICLKGPDPDEELKESQNALQTLGSCKTDVFSYSLPNGDGRSIIYVKKISQTPSKYPRQGVKISKKPLL